MLAPEQGSNNGLPACRFCDSLLRHTFVDLGTSPLCESYRTADELREVEMFYPLRVYLCANCFLVQLEEFVSPGAIFSEYAYFSSFSDSWLQHCSSYVDKMIERFHLNKETSVVEVASNDGYLLQYFAQRGVPVLGIEPAANIAEAAMNKGIPTRVEFFGDVTAQALVAEGKHADLIVGNNVLAQVPDVNDFVEGLSVLLKPNGVITIEFPHLLCLMEQNQFDTIYHEHFSYFSFLTTEKIFDAHGLTIFDVEELPTHGGSLRVYAKHADDQSKTVSSAVQELRRKEEAAGLASVGAYGSFARRVERTKWNLLEFLITAKREGKVIAGYGAPGKGNTLLNYCGIRSDLLEYTVDRNPYKQGKFLPGTHIPILHPREIQERKPDFVLILPWNLKDEIIEQLSYIRQWGGRFVVPIPTVEVYP